MAAEIQAVVPIALKVLLDGLFVLYVGLVLMALRTEGSAYALHVEWSHPARSVEWLLIWAGVRVVVRINRVAKLALATLFEASAEVGEWFLRRGGTAAGIRSKFL